MDALAGGDALKWDEVEKMIYANVFTKLKMFKADNQFARRYNEVLNPKIRR